MVITLIGRHRRGKRQGKNLPIVTTRDGDSKIVHEVLEFVDLVSDVNKEDSWKRRWKRR